MPGEEASISSGPRTVIALFVLLAPPLFAALAALAWILVHSFASTDGEVPKTPPFCCPDAMETILTLSNLTNDPCTDFLSYACYRKSEVDRTAVAVRAYMSAVVHPTLQAKLRSPVSDKIWTSHKSCLFAAVRNLFTPEHAVTAVIDLFHHWSGTSTSSPSASIDLVRLVSVLHFSYDISSVFSTYYKLSSKSDEAATFVICFRLAPDIGFVTLRDDHATFEAARRHAGVNASRADVSRLARLFRGARKTSVDENIIVPMALLDEKFPKEALSTWQDILSTLPAIAIKNPPDVAAVVRILMDESTLFQATALLYFSISTTLLMFSEEIRRAPSLADNAALCEGLTLELSPLWDVLATQQMTSPVRDQLVMRLYHRVSESVIADARHIFASHVDTEKVRRVVRSMRVVLAANLTSSYVRYLPFMSDDYFANKFEMRRFYSQLIKSNALRGLYGLYTLGVDLSRSFISRIEDQIAVAANVYALLSFSNDTGRGERSSESVHGVDVINAAVLGVMFADALWGKIFEPADWNRDTWRQLMEHQQCLQPRADVDALASDLKYPILSLLSTINAFAATSWHRRAPVFDFHSLSASQVFFVLFVVHHSCSSAGPDASGTRTSMLMRHFEEFRKAFGCAPLTKLRITDLCKKHQHEPE